MIGKLKGIIDSVEKDHIILDVSGVGYIVYASNNFLRDLKIGDTCSTLTDMHVREDNISLYGFINQDEQRLFRQLVDIKGIGPKLALNILGHIGLDLFITAIAAQDKAFFKSIQGVGPKLAERIVSELKGKEFHLSEINTSVHISKKITAQPGIFDDAVSALANLGYQKTQTYAICQKLLQDEPNLPLGNVIKLALKELTK